MRLHGSSEVALDFHASSSSYRASTDWASVHSTSMPTSAAPRERTFARIWASSSVGRTVGHPEVKSRCGGISASIAWRCTAAALAHPIAFFFFVLAGHRHRSRAVRFAVLSERHSESLSFLIPAARLSP